MCGRFSQFEKITAVIERFGVDSGVEGLGDPLFLRPRYNIAPTQIVPVVVGGQGRALRLMRWGLVPSWAKEQSISQKMINARAETLTEKSSFKRLLFSRRCIIPATGFYEWKKDGGRKLPLHFRLKSGGLFGFAGLWDRWKYPDGEGRDLESFTIITTSPNELLRQVHHRMPVILPREGEARWVDPGLKGAGELLSMLKPFPFEEMEGYPVTPLVNSPAFNASECVIPLKSVG